MGTLSQSINAYTTQVWDRYAQTVKLKLISGEEMPDKGLDYWRNELFINTAIVTVPISLLVTLPSVVMAWVEGMHWIALVDIIILVTIYGILFYTTLSMRTKMVIAISELTALAIFLLAATGSFGIGSIYLLALSVLISLLFPNRVAFYMFFFNVLVYVFFTVVIWTQAFAWPVVGAYKVGIWITYSVNFVFLNLMITLQIQHLLRGLEVTIVKEELLLQTLQDELQDKISRNKLLSESEEHYKSLFFNNPLPMWIFDPDTLMFLQVNESAVAKYGYTREEFTKMSVRALRTDPLEQILPKLRDLREIGQSFSSVSRHRKKNGREFDAKIRSSAIPFHGQLALLVIVNDITTQIAYIKAIEKQNNKLRHIAHLQSHTVRAPLARIKGLWSLIATDNYNLVDQELGNYLQVSLDELDEVIKGIIKDSEIVSSEGSEGAE